MLPIIGSKPIQKLSIPYGEYPSCLHTTLASLFSQKSSQMVPQIPFTQTSTLPSRSELPPPLMRTEPFKQIPVHSRVEITCKVQHYCRIHYGYTKISILFFQIFRKRYSVWQAHMGRFIGKGPLRVKFIALNMWNKKFLTKVGLLQFWVATVLRLNIRILPCQKVLIKWK